MGQNCAMMTYETLLALTGFAFVTSATPGPNNLMLMASGANFGMRRTVPHMLGISIGFSVMCVMVGFGVAGVIFAWPMADLVLRALSVVYMLWLAWKIARAGGPGEGRAGTRPMSFLAAAGFQWVNPKAWAMALGAIALYAPDQSLAALVLVAAVLGLVNLPTVSLWAAAGQGLRRVLTSPARLRAFNWTMAGLLVGSLLPVVWR